MEESTLMEETNNNRIQTRRTSRSTRSASPVMTEVDEDEGGMGSPVSSAENNHVGSNNVASATATATPSVNGGRVTRSQSVESSGYDTTDSRKRKRKAKDSVANKKRDMTVATPPLNYLNASTVTNCSQSVTHAKEDYERETRNTAQRMSKEAREAKRAQRDIIIKERLSELDKLEKAVKDGSHSEYHKLLGDIESKRTKMLNVAEMRRSLAEGNVTNFFNSQKYAAYSQYYWDKLALRRSMIQQVQQKINILEQEYYSNHPQNEEHLSEWVPPDRPSMINEEVEKDLEWAKQEPLSDGPSSSKDTLMNTSPNQKNSRKLSPNNVRESSPPLDMLASLADRQYQKDFKQESTEKSFTLPPLNPWSYDQQRPTLPT